MMDCHFERRLVELAGPDALAKRAQQRAAMKRLRARAADNGYEPERWAAITIWDARRRAKGAGLAITIDSEWVRRRLDQIGHRCEVSGIVFSHENPTQAHKRPFMPSLDRIDCRVGYVPENVRIVCVSVNMLLQDWGIEVYRRLIAAHQNAHHKSEGDAWLGG